MNVRSVALKVLTEVEEGAFLNLSIKNNLRGLDEQSKRFLAALVYTTLENQIRIDYVIDHFTPGKRIHRLVRNILRLGVCQLMFLESVPESAAVNESVKLMAASKKRELKGFVNAVLRTIAGNLGDIAYPSREEEPVRFLSVLCSYPEWIVKMYVLDYGFDFAWEMLSYKKTSGSTSVRVNTLKTDMETLLRKLIGRGYETDKARYDENCLYIKNLSAVDELDLYRQGLLTVQGEASMLVCRLAGLRGGEKVLDACAAPGGKTACLACFSPSYLEAWDIHEHRLELMRQNFARLGVQAEVLLQDASLPLPDRRQSFDVVLVDAPCSALGLLYRKPDLKYSKEQADLAALAEIQKKILRAAAEYVRPGGRLVYSTCTIDRRENDEVVDQILHEREDMVEGDARAFLPEALLGRVKGGRLQLFPHIDGIDGFFMALLEKKP